MSNNTYIIPPFVSGPLLSKKKIRVTLCPEALRLKNDYREALQKYPSDPRIIEAFKKHGIYDQYKLTPMGKEHAEECIGLAAYQFAGMGGMKQMLLGTDLREMLFYMHTIVHLAIAFGTSACILDAQTHAVWVCDKMNYECELEAKCIATHPLIQQLLTYKKYPSHSNGKTQAFSVNHNNVKWRTAYYGMYYCRKPQCSGEHIQIMARLPMYGISYALGYQYYFHFETNMNIRPDPIKTPEFTCDYSLPFSNLVFSNGKTFMDLLSANRSRYHPEMYGFFQKVMLPNARTTIAVIFYDRVPRHLSVVDIILRYVDHSNYILKTKPPAKL
ncbi:hypothetical protein RFI_11619 [Reticulomyxa filosa]|uniref:Uncharacterized protein n=1 Tax=Reticulomyxa filosa TaxID=46433 RepID=X6NJI5_RETFI|nr:hypothetical protein RFI_11619 [Reticulomyxa filosa]|eukprot:ETO25517.1 hypothetical protein RFI_11619 [Reticulomyxa filosa]